MQRRGWNKHIVTQDVFSFIKEAFDEDPDVECEAKGISPEASTEENGELSFTTSPYMVVKTEDGSVFRIMVVKAILEEGCQNGK